VLFAGRLADYKYYNMDQAVARALGVFEKLIAGDAENRPRGPSFPLQP
jgi:UDP-galactopyranose mutase